MILLCADTLARTPLGTAQLQSNLTQLKTKLPAQNEKWRPSLYCLIHFYKKLGKYKSGLGLENDFKTTESIWKPHKIFQHRGCWSGNEILCSNKQVWSKLLLLSTGRMIYCSRSLQKDMTRTLFLVLHMLPMKMSALQVKNIKLTVLTEPNQHKLLMSLFSGSPSIEITLDSLVLTVKKIVLLDLKK